MCGTSGWPDIFNRRVFFGYYFNGRSPVVLARHWKVTLDAAPLLVRVRQIVERITDNQYSIVTEADDTPPDYLLIHDRYDGSCWLWGFDTGKRFVESYNPVAFRSPTTDEIIEGEGDGGRKLLGP